MKKNLILTTLLAIAFNFLIGGVVGYVFEKSVPAFGLLFILLGIVLGETRLYFEKRGYTFLPKGLAYAGLLKEIWISVLMEVYYANYTFLSRSQDMSEFVDNNIINLADCGVDPEVFVNNTVYPIPISERTDTPLELPLDYFDSENTVVRNAIQKQMVYSQMASVVKQHRNAIQLKCAKKATYLYGPASNTDFTPVKSTTGDARGDGNRAMRLKDISSLQTMFDDINAPMEGRILVLSPKHRQDLMDEDTKLFKTFSNLKTGEILQMFGFDIYWTQLTPKYNNATGVKTPFGAAATGTDAISSLAYLESEVMRADGTYDMFSRLNDPEQRGDIVGFQKRFLGMPIRNKYFAAIYDALDA